MQNHAKPAKGWPTQKKKRRDNYAKGVVIEQQKTHQHGQAPKAGSKNKEEGRATLEECFLRNEKRKNGHNKRKGGQQTSQNAGKC